MLEPIQQHLSQDNNRNDTKTCKIGKILQKTLKTPKTYEDRKYYYSKTLNKEARHFSV